MKRKLNRNYSPSGISGSVAILMIIALFIAAAAAAGRNPHFFLPAVDYGSGGYTWHHETSIAMGDVNGDGRLDLVVGNECASSNCENGEEGAIGVLLGNGDGTFQPSIVYGSGGSQAEAVAIGDVNGDGKPDIVVVNGDGTLAVLLGNGDGTFQPATVEASGVGAPMPTSLAIADVNGDGIPDVLVADWCTDSNCDGAVSVLLGNGDGTFHAAVAYSSGGRFAQSVAVADVNHDGKPDLLVANRCAGSCSKNAGAVAVLLGNGDGTFQTATSYDSGGVDATSVTVADVNWDGNLDLEVSNLSGTVGVLLGKGDGSFQPAVSYSSYSGKGGGAAVSVKVVDVDLDGHPDLVVLNQTTFGNAKYESEVSVLLGNGDGTFQPAFSYRSGAYQAASFAIGDVNGDGRPDLAVANSCANNNNCGGTDEAPAVVGLLLNNTGTTTTAVTTSGSPSLLGQAVTFTATVTAAHGKIPDGQLVTFYDGKALLGSVPLADGTAAFTTSSLKAGTHDLKAKYAGGATFKPSTGSVKQVVEK